MKRLYQNRFSLLLVGGTICYLSYALTETINSRLELLPILPADPSAGTVTANEISPSLKKLYPLVARNTTPQTVTESGVIDLNAAFMAPKVDLAPAAPDYFSALKDKNVMQLQAISDDGAIISDRFVAYGDPVSAFEYPLGNGPKMTAPILARSKAPSSVVIKEHPGKRTFILAL